MRERASKRATARGGAESSTTIIHQDLLTSHVTQSMRLNGTADITSVPPPPLPPHDSAADQRGNPPPAPGTTSSTAAGAGAGVAGSGELKFDRSAIRSLQNHFLYLDRNLRSIEANVNDMLGILREKDLSREVKEMKLEWHIVAMTLDRFFFIVFVIAIVTSLITLFPRPYSLQF